jgi:hypothetical protein
MRRFWQAISIAVFGFDTVVAVIASSLIVVSRAEATLRQFPLVVNRRVVSALELVSKKLNDALTGHTSSKDNF